MPGGTAERAITTLSRRRPQVAQMMSPAMTRLTRGSIQAAPGQHDDEAGHHHAGRDGGIGQHVQVGAADVDVVAARGEEPGGDAVDEDAEARHHHHGQARHRLGLAAIRRATASRAMAPVATSRNTALNRAARIEEPRRP